MSACRRTLPFIFLLDLETTGLSSKTCKIIEISCIRCRIEESCLIPEAEYTTIVQPRDVALVTETVTGNVHKITSGLLRAAPLFEAVAPGFLHFILSCRTDDNDKFLLCAHNGDSFDFPVLKREMASVGVSLPEDSIVLLDTLRLVRSSRCLEAQSTVLPGGYSLQELYSFCTGKRGDQRHWHSAIDDARALLSVCNDQRVFGLLRSIASTNASSGGNPTAAPPLEPAPRPEPHAELTDAHPVHQEEEDRSSGSEGLDLARLNLSGSSDARSDSSESDSHDEDNDAAVETIEPDNDFQWHRGKEFHFSCENEFIPYRSISLGRIRSPLESFLRIYHSVEKMVVVNTNSYAERKLAGLVIVSALHWKRATQRHQCKEEHEQYFKGFMTACSNLKRWKPVTLAEMRRYLGLRILAETCAQTSSRRFWWSEKKYYGWDAAAKTMSRRRFEEITRFLHVAPWPYCVDESGASFDPMQKVRDFATSLFGKFNTLHKPSHDVFVDDIMVKFTGRTKMSVSNPHKPSARRGFRLIAAVDRNSRYILNAIAYEGAGRNCSAFYRPEQHGANTDADDMGSIGLATQSVHKLMKPYFHHGHIVYCDRFFTSVELFEHLLCNGTFACGTAMARRRGFPRGLSPQDQIRAAPRGTSFHAIRGKMAAVAWKDRKIVHALSTCCSTDEFDLAYRRVSGGVVALRRPRLLSVYNDRMNGVDVFNQVRSYFATEMSNVRKWWHHIFSGLLIPL